VIVVGGGIGGLALAQGLRRRGLAVAVFERDRSPADRLQGYRVHINTEGSRALHACLPREIFAAFLATCGQPNTGIGIATHRLRELIWFGDTRPNDPSDAIDGVKSASRVSLRQVLLAELSEVVHFGKSFSYYEHTDDGQVIARFADGSTARGDVLVGADGASSTVRRQRLPHAEPIDTGVVGIQGKVWLTDQVRTMLPGRLAHGPLMIPGPRGLGMFLAVHEFSPIPPELAVLVGPEATGQRDYVMWGLLTRRALLPSGLEQLNQEGLRALALQRISAWHPTLRRLVAASDLETMLLTPIRSAVPLEAWPTTSVTLLGDAVHSMPPTGGVGANTALRDAALLTTKLASVARGERRLLSAIADYEAEMRDYGFAAVRGSLHNLHRQQRTENPLVLAGMRFALRALNRVPPLKRRAFA
jgi:2-polyprenyl-6-methoxyphenol hydroxylase-like FAD-dependent oxidoreductase